MIDLSATLGEMATRINNLQKRLNTLETQDKTGNYTSGGVLFGGSNGKITTDATNLYWDDTNNRLGIGTASPTGFLEITAAGGTKKFLRINDSAASSDTYLSLENSGGDVDGNTYWMKASRGNAVSFYARGDGGVLTSGTGAGFAFTDRSSTNLWQWYGTGNIARLYNGTNDTISISDSGAMNLVINDAVTNTNTTGLTLWHRTSGTAANGFGFAQAINLEDDGGTDRTAADLRYSWATAASATRKARVQHVVYDTAAREFLRGEASGSAPMIGFLGSAASAKLAVTGSRGGNAALASLLTQLATYGLITDSSSA